MSYRHRQTLDRRLCGRVVTDNSQLLWRALFGDGFQIDGDALRCIGNGITLAGNTDTINTQGGVFRFDFCVSAPLPPVLLGV